MRQEQISKDITLTLGRLELMRIQDASARIDVSVT